MAARDEKCRYWKQKPVGKRKIRVISKVNVDDNYSGSTSCMVQDCVIPNCQADYHIELHACQQRDLRKDTPRKARHAMFRSEHEAWCR